MASEEICIIIIPNDFPNQNTDDDDQKTNDDGKHYSSQNIHNINERRRSKDNEEIEDKTISMLVQSMIGEKLSEHPKLTKQASITSLKKHSKDYPCPECHLSLASRFRYHIIPKLKLRDTIWIPTNNNKNFFILSYTELGPQSDGILDELRRAEIGIRDQSKVFIIPLSCSLGIRKVVQKQKILPNTPLTTNLPDEEKPNGGIRFPLTPHIPSLNWLSDEFSKSIRARMTVHKVLGLIQCQSALTFDYIFFCILASIIAALGLLENNTVILVASMLVSPLMGPIMGFVFGIRIRDRNLWLSGLKCECIGISIAILTGFFFGLCTTWSETKWGSSQAFPTDEMRTRGDYRRLWFGALVALPSGAAAALSILGGNFGSLVGVAISASLLPPAVNTGLLFSYSLLSACRSEIGRHLDAPMNRTGTYHSLSSFVNCTPFVDNDYFPLYSCDMPKEASQLGIFSLIITIVNILCICFMVVMILFIKKVVPIIPDDEITKFWREDLKMSNHSNHDNQSNLADILQTMADGTELVSE